MTLLMKPPAMLAGPGDDREQTCRSCQCTDVAPCDQESHGWCLACWWIEHDLCSACEGKAQEAADD